MASLKAHGPTPKARSTILASPTMPSCRAKTRAWPLRSEAAAMEATGLYWETPWDALTEAGVEVQLLHAQQVKQLRGRKTDIEDSWATR